jgi:hypothetical protein
VVRGEGYLALIIFEAIGGHLGLEAHPQFQKLLVHK